MLLIALKVFVNATFFSQTISLAYGNYRYTLMFNYWILESMVKQPVRYQIQVFKMLKTVGRSIRDC